MYSPNGPSKKDFFNIQKNISKEIIELEDEIRQIKKAREAKTINKQVFIREKEAFRFTIDVFHLLADSIVWRFIPSFEIRQNCKCPKTPGFLSDKNFNKELVFAENIVDTHDCFVLIHDITNCMRIGDLTIFNDNKKSRQTLELKFTSGRNTPKGKREERQIERMNALSEYLDKKSLYGKKLDFFPPNERPPKPGECLIKVDTKNKSTDKFNLGKHRKKINGLLKKTRKDKETRFWVYKDIVGYLVYSCPKIIDKHMFPEDVTLKTKKFINSCRVEVYGDIFHRIVDHQEIIPFTLFLEPEICIDLIYSDLSLITFVNDKKLLEYIKKNTELKPEINIERKKHFLNDGINCKKGKIYLNHELDWILYALSPPEDLLNYCEELKDGFKLFKDIHKK